MGIRFPAVPFALSALIALLNSLIAPAQAADRLRLAVQATGTSQWELAQVAAAKLDKDAKLDLEITTLASTDAGKIALLGGGADVIVSDWLWVARERAGGVKLQFYPVSTGIGAVMTKNAALHGVADLAGKKLGVAGGELDKSWVLLKAYALRQGVDLEKNATIVYGAPPLLAAKAEQGELDAVLEFWNFALDLETKGFRRAIDMRDVEKALGAKAESVVTGYVFSQDFAKTHAEVLTRFFAMMKRARADLGTPDNWRARAAPLIHAQEGSASDLYWRYYKQSAPQGSLKDQEADAAALYAVLAQTGGEKLVGPMKTLDPETFYKGAR